MTHTASPKTKPGNDAQAPSGRAPFSLTALRDRTSAQIKRWYDALPYGRPAEELPIIARAVFDNVRSQARSDTEPTSRIEHRAIPPSDHAYHSSSEIDAVVAAAAGQQDAAAYRNDAITGLRRRELMARRRRDIDFAAQAARVRAAGRLDVAALRRGYTAAANRTGLRSLPFHALRHQLESRRRNTPTDTSSDESTGVATGTIDLAPSSDPIVELEDARFDREVELGIERDVQSEPGLDPKGHRDPEQPAAPLSRWAARRAAVAGAMSEEPSALMSGRVADVALPVPQPQPLPVPVRLPGWSIRALPGLLARRRVALAVGALLLLSALAHGIGLLHYPYLQQDEGTYFSDAWAVFHLGRLAPYTYFYDHAPFGWIQIAIWQLFTGAMSLGYGLASGRVLMVLFQLGSALLVIGIGRRATGRLWVGLLAAALMSLEPVGILYQRQILLDNIAVFWMLLSVYAVAGPITLRRVWLSAASLALAILSKEVAIAAFPVLAVFVWRRSPREIRLLAGGSWLAVSLALCSVYLVMALIKGELFPAGALFGGSHPHVSLLCSIEWQGSRGGGSLLNLNGQFWTQMHSWLKEAPLPVAGGTWAAIGLITVGRRLGVATMIGWITVALWLFLGRGGVVNGYYLVPLLPFLALSVTMAANAMAGLLKPRGRRWSLLGVAVLTAVLVGSTAVSSGEEQILGQTETYSGAQLWTSNQVSGQLAAERWIDAHLARNARMVIDMSMWQDLHYPGSGRPFNDAEYYWKAANDPTIRQQVFHDNWRNVDYVITTPELIQDTISNGFPVVERALAHSQLVRTFVNGGWVIEIRRVVPDSRHVLFRSSPVAVGVTGSTTTPNGCVTNASS